MPEGRPVIGICAAFETAAWSFWNEPAHLVSNTYVGDVQRAGALAVLLAVEPSRPEALIDRVDGLLLIGGADVDPATYGSLPDPATEATNPERDRFEVALVRRAIESGKPVLGICRGMQILNVAFGGTLRQDVRDEDGATPHRRRLGGFEGTDHPVALTAGSLAARAHGDTVADVHCHHHQAVDTLGEGLTVSGLDEVDGVSEALETADGSWTLGVQWHPEAERDGPVIRSFVRACRQAAIEAGTTSENDIARAA